MLARQFSTLFFLTTITCSLTARSVESQSPLWSAASPTSWQSWTAVSDISLATAPFQAPLSAVPSNKDAVCLPLLLEQLFWSDVASVIGQFDPDLLFLQRTPKHLAPRNCPAVLLHRSIRLLSASILVSNSLVHSVLTISHTTSLCDIAKA